MVSDPHHRCVSFRPGLHAWRCLTFLLIASLSPLNVEGNEDLDELLTMVKSLREDMHVTLSYLEYPLANIGTQEQDWSAYHSGLALNLEDGRVITVDYRPRDPEHLMNFLRPLISYTGQWPFWDVKMNWMNEGYVGWENYMEPRFTNITYIGDCTAKQLVPLVKWTIQFKQNNDMFQPISLVQNLSRTIIESTTCHDFVQGAIMILFENGGTFSQAQSSMVFRDSVLIFSDKDPEIVPHDTLMGYLSILVYFRYFSYFVPSINRNFIHARAYLNEGTSQNVPFILYSDKVYYRLYLRFPYIDYCYTTIHLPHKDKEMRDLANRFRHCKFTKASFPDTDDGAKRLEKPLAQAFSSTVGWLRESAILIIPAALKTNPPIAYGLVAVMSVLLFLASLAMLRVPYMAIKRRCGCSAVSFASVMAFLGVALGLALVPLSRPVVDKEPNNIKNWGFKGPLSKRTFTESDTPAFLGVYQFESLNDYVLAIDTSYMTLDHNTGTGWLAADLDFNSPTLLAAVNVARGSNRNSVFAFDGLKFLRLLQLLRASIHIEGDSTGKTFTWTLSLFGSISLLGKEGSEKLWRNTLGVGGGDVTVSEDLNELLVTTRCSGKGLLSCPDDIKLTCIMKQDGPEDANMRKFDRTFADVLAVGL